MRLTFITAAASLTLLAPALSFGAGSAYSTPPPSSGIPSSGQGDNGFVTHDGYGMHRSNPTATATPKSAVQQQPYDIGEAIFNGTYRPKKAANTHVAEKVHRLNIIRTGLSPEDQKHFNPSQLGSTLSDREVNDLEYYIKEKYGRFVTSTPSWAKKEPPIKAP